MPDVDPHPVADPPFDAGFEAALIDWLRHDVGFDEYRRIARVTADEVQLTKFDAGGLKRVFDAMDLASDLLDAERSVEAYARQAARSGPDVTRVATWAAAAHALLSALGAQHGIDEAALHDIRVGVDSVEAILGDVLRSRPRVGDDYTPRPAEVAAYRAMVGTLRGHQVFERYYGTFRGHAVRDYCPAVPSALTMIATAWRACTGTPPPV